MSLKLKSRPFAIMIGTGVAAVALTSLPSSFAADNLFVAQKLDSSYAQQIIQVGNKNSDARCDSEAKDKTSDGQCDTDNQNEVMDESNGMEQPEDDNDHKSNGDANHMGEPSDIENPTHSEAM